MEISFLKTRKKLLYVGYPRWRGPGAPGHGLPGAPRTFQTEETTLINDFCKVLIFSALAGKLWGAVLVSNLCSARQAAQPS